MEDYSDIVSDDEWEELEQYISETEGEEPPAMEELVPGSYYSGVIVVRNVPAVPESKIAKLSKLLMKIFGSVGRIVPESLTMPMGDAGKTIGVAVVEFESEEEADAAVKALSNYRLDKAHVFQAVKYDDYLTCVAEPEDFVEPEEEAYVEPPDLRSHLLDEAGRDQFVLRHGSKTQVMWSHGSTKVPPELVYGGERHEEMGRTWCEALVQWSPLGSYLVTFHRPGIVLWGSEDMHEVGRFPHEGIEFIHFSPNEKYVVTWNGNTSQEVESIIVWEVASGRALRAFKHNGRAESWPFFKWNHDGSYLARCKENGISIYQTPGMGLIGKKSLPAPNVAAFEWSPVDNLLAYWSPPVKHTAARLSIVSIPDRRELRRLNQQYVKDVRFLWQTAGDFLLAHVQKTSKSGKTDFTSVEVFRVRDRDIPTEMIDLEQQSVAAVAFEPAGVRFAVAHGDAPTRQVVSIYDLGRPRGGRKMQTVVDLPAKPVNRLLWSPSGRHLLMAGLMGSMSGDLEFYDADEKKVLGTGEHYMATVAAWDPSGRVAMTAVVRPLHSDDLFRSSMDTGYKLWTFQGKELRKEAVSSFYQFIWRPRPPSLLTTKEKRKVDRNLKAFVKVYGEKDNIAEREREADFLEKRVALLSAYNALREENEAWARERGLFIDLPSEYEEIEVDDEFIVEEIREEVPDGEDA